MTALGALRFPHSSGPVPEKSKGEGPKLAHTAPRRQLVITLDGYLEFKSCDIDEHDDEHIAIIRRGDILLADDLEGAGHVWKFLEDDRGEMFPWLRCYIHLGEEYEHFIQRLENN